MDYLDYTVPRNGEAVEKDGFRREVPVLAGNRLAAIRLSCFGELGYDLFGKDADLAKVIIHVFRFK
jgi:hypothetical protein